MDVVDADVDALDVDALVVDAVRLDWAESADGDGKGAVGKAVGEGTVTGRIASGCHSVR